MKVNSIRGTILEDRELFLEEEGEKYYKTYIIIEEQKIPLVASMFVLRDKKGKCDVTCIVKQEPGRKHRFVYLYAATITSCDESLPDINKFNIGGHVVKVYPPTFVGSMASELLITKIAWRSGKGTNIINIRALGQSARRLSDVKLNQVLNCTCYIQMFNDNIDFYILKSRRRNVLEKRGNKKNGSS